MKTNVLFAFALGLTLTQQGRLSAFPSGISGYSGNPATNGGRTCTNCHGGGITPTVNLSGPMSVTPGAINTYVLTISGGQRLFGGLDVSATSGTLAAFESGTQLLSGEVTHTSPKAVNASGAVSFSFQWTAPSSPGTATLYGAGLSANGSGTSGDDANLMAMAISVQSLPVPNQPPVADAGGPYSGITGSVVSMDGSKSYDPDGKIVSFSWDYGDGSALGSGMNPSYIYVLAGAYTVTLTVTDDKGSTGKKQTAANISAPGNQPPVAHAGGPYTVALGSPVQFNGSTSTDPDGTIVSYSWDYGDGSLLGAGDKPTHLYAAAGAFTVTLTVTDDKGLTDTDQTAVQVTDGSAAITCRLLAPDSVRLGRNGSLTVNVVLDAYVGALPPGTNACGKAYLFKNGVQIDAESICVEVPDPTIGGSVDGVADGSTTLSGERKTLLLKIATGIQVQARESSTVENSDQLVRFTPTITSQDGRTINWSGYVEIESYRSETATKTTQVTTTTRK